MLESSKGMDRFRDAKFTVGDKTRIYYKIIIATDRHIRRAVIRSPVSTGELQRGGQKEVATGAISRLI